jgi:predicted acylesterase/phospholipase RssA
MTFRDNRRIGIVLSGGGAKGAYQIGCLRALREAAGLGEVRAIAGTSVGAMHAALFSADRLDEAESIWRRTRFRDVAALTTSRLSLLPLWVVAGLGSEFSPFKVWRLADSATHPVRWRRAVYPVACLAMAVALAVLSRVVPAPGGAVAGGFAWAFAACAILSVAHERLRPYFLSASPMSHGPVSAALDGAMTEAACARLRERQVPVYATVSDFRPYTRASIPWGGWAPRYVRLDRMPRGELLETLVSGSALPGFSSPHNPHALTIVDGAWTDNVPAAPLLFDGTCDLDLVFVISLKQRARYRHRHNSLLRVAAVFTEGLLGLRADGVDDLVAWAHHRWQASGGRPLDGAPVLPQIVQVSPSRRVGNFFTGTVWFSPAQSSRLIALGYGDMQRTLAALEADAATSAERSFRPGIVVDPAIG